MCDGRKQCSKGLRVVRLLKQLLHAKAALLLKLNFLQHADLVCAVSACRPGENWVERVQRVLGTKKAQPAYTVTSNVVSVAACSVRLQAS